MQYYTDTSLIMQMLFPENTEFIFIIISLCKSVRYDVICYIYLCICFVEIYRSREKKINIYLKHSSHCKLHPFDTYFMRMYPLFVNFITFFHSISIQFL